MGYLQQVLIVLLLIAHSGCALDDGLSFQNKLRKTHNAPDLKLNKEMSKEAEKYASVLADESKLEHSKSKDGENLAMGCSQDTGITFDDAIKMWYEEVCNPGYQFNDGDFSTATGHFTQVVWKNTKEFGIGKKSVKKNGMNCTYVVGRYRPAGNYKGQFKENVLKGCFNQTSCSALDSPIESQSGSEDNFSENEHENEKSNNENNDTSEREGANADEGNGVPSEATASEIGDAIAEEIDHDKEKNGNPISKITLNIAQATAIGAHAGAQAGAEAGKKAGKKAAEEVYKNKPRGGSKRAETAVARNKHRVNAGVSIVNEGALNQASLLANSSENRKFFTFHNTSDFFPIPAKIRGTNRTIINRTLLIPEEARLVPFAENINNRTLNDSLIYASPINQTITSPQSNNISIPSYTTANSVNITAETNSGLSNANDGPTTSADELSNKIMNESHNIVSDLPNRQPDHLLNVSNNVANNNINDVNNNSITNNMTSNADINSIPDSVNADQNQTMFQNLTKQDVTNNTLQQSNLTVTGSNDIIQNNQDMENRASQLVDDSFVNEVAINATADNNALQNLPEINVPSINGSSTDDNIQTNSNNNIDPQNSTLNQIPKKKNKARQNLSHQFTKLLKDNPIIRLDNKEASQRPLNVIFHNETAVQFKNASHAMHSKLRVANSNLSGIVMSEEETSKKESKELSFEERALKAHNIFRAIHESDEMTLDPALNEAAENYAKKLAEKGVLEHSKDRDNAGENLAFGCTSETGKEMKAEDAVKDWYAEVCEPGYNFEAGTFNGATGHFTQVVWSESTQLGIGKATSDKDDMTCTYVVGRYKPAGNFQGKYDNNVKKGSFNTEEVCTKLDDLIANIGGSDQDQKSPENNTATNSQNNETPTQDTNDKPTDSNDQTPQNEADKTKADGEKVADGGNKPSDGENKAADGDNKAADGENKAAGGDNKAAGEDNKPADGDNKPADGYNDVADGDKGADGEVEIEEAALAIAREEAIKAAVEVGKRIGKEIGEEYFASQRDSIINSSKQEIVPSAKEAVESTLNSFKKRAQRKLTSKFLTFLRRQVRAKKSAITTKKPRKKKKKKRTNSRRKRKSHVTAHQSQTQSHVTIFKSQEKSYVTAHQSQKKSHVTAHQSQEKSHITTVKSHKKSHVTPHQSQKKSRVTTVQLQKSRVADAQSQKKSHVTHMQSKRISYVNNDASERTSQVTSHGPRSSMKGVRSSQIKSHKSSLHSQRNSQLTPIQLQRNSQLAPIQSQRKKSQLIAFEPERHENSSKKSNFQDIIKMGAKIGAIEGAKAGAIAGAKAAAEAISRGDETGGLGDLLGDNKKDKDKNKNKDDKKEEDKNKEKDDKKEEDKDGNKDKNKDGGGADHGGGGDADKGGGGGADQGGGDNDPANGEKPGEAKPGKGKSGDNEPGPGEGVPINPNAGVPPIEAKNDTAGNLMNNSESNASNNNDDNKPENPTNTGDNKNEDNANNNDNKPENPTNNNGDNKTEDNDSNNNDNKPENPTNNGGNKTEDKFESLQGAVDKAISDGGQEGGKAGAEAAIKSYGCNAAKKDLIDILAHPNTRQLDNSFVTEGITNYDPIVDTTGNDLQINSPALRKKLAHEGAVVGVVEGARAAASACVEAAGGSEVDKQQAETNGKARGEKILENRTLIDEIVAKAVEDAPKCDTKPPKTSTTQPGKFKSIQYGQAPTHTGTFGKSQTANEFARKGLEAHNIFREIHSSHPLHMNSELNRQAEEYAKLLSETGELKHAPPEDRNNNGENLAFACTSRKHDTEMRAEQAVVNWYEEVCRPRYNFDTPNSHQDGTLHFSQIVWHGTHELGMGKAVSNKDGITCTYVVARYKPAGNKATQFSTNVEQGTFDESLCNRLDDLVKGINDKPQVDLSPATVRNTTTDFDGNPDTENDSVTIINVDNSHVIGHRKEAVGMRSDDTELHNLKLQKNLSKTFSVIHENENTTLHYMDVSTMLAENETHEKANRRHNTTMTPIEEVSNKRNKTSQNETANIIGQVKNETKKVLNQSKPTAKEDKQKLDEFISQSLDAHNRYRELHAVSQLILDEKLTKQAQKYAEKLANKGQLEHDKTMEDGENLAMKCIGPQEADPTGAFFTTLWYQEVCNPGYNFEKPKFSESTGHFTQIAWKSTERLGVGRAFKYENGTKCEYVVGRYQPAGNFLEEFPDNVYQGNYDKSICQNIVGSKKHSTPRYTKHKSRAAKFRGLVL